MTGRILGVVAVIYGITGVQFNITPEFEQKVLGRGYIYERRGKNIPPAFDSFKSI